jgi:hypothetical protein
VARLNLKLIESEAGSHVLIGTEFEAKAELHFSRDEVSEVRAAPALGLASGPALASWLGAADTALYRDMQVSQVKVDANHACVVGMGQLPCIGCLAAS